MKSTTLRVMAAGFAASAYLLSACTDKAHDRSGTEINSASGTASKVPAAVVERAAVVDEVFNPPVTFQLSEMADARKRFSHVINPVCVRRPGSKALPFAQNGKEGDARLADVNVSLSLYRHPSRPDHEILEYMSLADPKDYSWNRTDYTRAVGNRAEPAELSPSTYLFKRSRSNGSFMDYRSVTLSDFRKLSVRRHENPFPAITSGEWQEHDLEYVIEFVITLHAGDSGEATVGQTKLECRLHGQTEMQAARSQVAAKKAEEARVEQQQQAHTALANDPNWRLIQRVNAAGGNCPTLAQHLATHRERAVQNGDWSGFQQTLGRAEHYGCL